MLLEDERRAILLDTLVSHRFMADSRWADANPMLRGAMTRLRYRNAPKVLEYLLGKYGPAVK
ncbi:MAG: hypothetical protein ACREI3_09050 [Nitrospirales bacterium]